MYIYLWFDLVVLNKKRNSCIKMRKYQVILSKSSQNVNGCLD